MKRKAFLTVLSQKLRESEVLFLDKLSILEIKTKKAQELIKRLQKIKEFANLGSKNGRVLIYLNQPKEETILSLCNLPYVKISETKNTNVLDLLSNKFIILTKEGIEQIQNSKFKMQN